MIFVKLIHPHFEADFIESTQIKLRHIGKQHKYNAKQQQQQQNIPSTTTKQDTHQGIILGMDSANERWRYIVTSSLIGWAHTRNDPCHATTKM